MSHHQDVSFVSMGGADAALGARRTAHLQHVKDTFLSVVHGKYLRGAVEHEGLLADLPPAELIREALMESVDSFTYLLTALDRLHESGDHRTPAIEPWLARLIDAEATRTHAMGRGVLTDEHFRAFTILTEEVGEVGRALLSLRSAASSGNGPGSAYERDQAIAELVQVIVTAAKLASNLRKLNFSITNDEGADDGPTDSRDSGRAMGQRVQGRDSAGAGAASGG